MKLHRDREIGQQAIPEDERPEPFATVMELVREHGNRAVIEALADNAGFDAEDQDLCFTCRQEDAWLHLELSRLLERNELLFREPEPVVKREDPALVQLEFDFNDDNQRIGQVKAISADGKEDAEEIALAEMLAGAA